MGRLSRRLRTRRSSATFDAALFTKRRFLRSRKSFMPLPSGGCQITRASECLLERLRRLSTSRAGISRLPCGVSPRWNSRTCGSGRWLSARRRPIRDTRGKWLHAGRGCRAGWSVRRGERSWWRFLRSSQTSPRLSQDRAFLLSGPLCLRILVLAGSFGVFRNG